MLAVAPVLPRCATLALLLYVSLDLSNPHMPGAFNFDPDDCVESVQAPSLRSLIRIDTATFPRPWMPDPDAVLTWDARRSERGTAAPLFLGDWIVNLRRAHPPAARASSSEDAH